MSQCRSRPPSLSTPKRIGTEQTKSNGDNSHVVLVASTTKMIFCFFMGMLCSNGSGVMFRMKQTRKLLLQEGMIDPYEVESSPVASTNTPTSFTATIINPHEAGNQSAFASIVEYAYEIAFHHKRIIPERNIFDVDWWETESGLNTTGGLNHDDRAVVGKLYHDAQSVFEYGLGESTYIANYVGVPRYSGIDSDPVWVGMARDKVSPNFRFYLGDIGKTREWGFPSQPYNPKYLLNYQLSPLIVEPLPFDVYMVDGRWRLPILLASFLHASDRGADHNHTIAMIHDCQRFIYRAAEHLLQLQSYSTPTLCVYQRKTETTDEELKKLWYKHKSVVMR